MSAALPDEFYLICMFAGKAYTNAHILHVCVPQRQAWEWKHTGYNQTVGLPLNIEAEETVARINSATRYGAHSLHKAGEFEGKPARFVPIINDWVNRSPIDRLPSNKLPKTHEALAAWRKVQDVMCYIERKPDATGWSDFMTACAKFWQAGSLMSEAFVAPLWEEMGNKKHGGRLSAYLGQGWNKRILKGSLGARLEVVTFHGLRGIKKHETHLSRELTVLRDKLGISEEIIQETYDRQVQKAIERKQRRSLQISKSTRQWFQMHAALGQMANLQMSA